MSRFYGSVCTNLLLSNGIKTVSLVKRIHGEVAFTFTNFAIQKCDGQKNKTEFGENDSPT